MLSHMLTLTCTHIHMHLFQLIEDLELSHDQIKHLDTLLVQRNKEINQLQKRVSVLQTDVEGRVKYEMVSEYTCVCVCVCVL